MYEGSAWNLLISPAPGHTHAFVCVFNKSVLHTIGDWCTGPLYQVDNEITNRTLTSQR